MLFMLDKVKLNLVSGQTKDTDTTGHPPFYFMGNLVEPSRKEIVRKKFYLFNQFWVKPFQIKFRRSRDEVAKSLLIAPLVDQIFSNCYQPRFY